MTVEPEIPVPPQIYGGVERIVHGLIREYNIRGHIVYLMANALSQKPVKGELISWKGKSSVSYKDTFKNAFQLYQVYNDFKPDVIHSFSRLLYLYPLLLLSRNVKIFQSYGRLISNRSTSIAAKLGKDKLNFTSCAQHMLLHLSNSEKWKVFYNFTDTNFFVPIENPSLDYFAFLGRIEPIKGPIDAIKAAIASNSKLILAGNVPSEHKDYFSNYIQPYFNHPLISYIGPVNDENKRNFLQNAKALLFPINLKSEAFGIVMVESTACGTPVIAFDIAAVPEVIRNGVNGYRVKNVDEMAEKMLKINDLSRYKVWQDTVKRFSQELIANQYLQYFSEKL